MVRWDVREHARAVLTTPLVEDGADVEVFLLPDVRGMNKELKSTLREVRSPTLLEVHEIVEG